MYHINLVIFSTLHMKCNAYILYTILTLSSFFFSQFDVRYSHQSSTKSVTASESPILMVKHFLTNVTPYSDELKVEIKEYLSLHYDSVGYYSHIINCSFLLPCLYVILQFLNLLHLGLRSSFVLCYYIPQTQTYFFFFGYTPMMIELIGGQRPMTYIWLFIHMVGP